MEISQFLTDWLSGAERLAVIGAGSTLKSDDGAGTILAEMLKDHFAAEACPRVLFCPGETAPENFTGKIIAFCPTHILMIDAADVGLAPGEFTDIAPERVGGPAFLTHMLPLKVMINYLTVQTGAQAKLVGIQARSIRFDGEMTSEVRGAVDTAFDALCGVIRDQFL